LHFESNVWIKSENQRLLLKFGDEKWNWCPDVTLGHLADFIGANLRNLGGSKRSNGERKENQCGDKCSPCVCSARANFEIGATAGLELRAIRSFAPVIHPYFCSALPAEDVRFSSREDMRKPAKLKL